MTWRTRRKRRDPAARLQALASKYQAGLQGDTITHNAFLGPVQTMATVDDSSVVRREAQLVVSISSLFFCSDVLPGTENAIVPRLSFAQTCSRSGRAFGANKIQRSNGKQVGTVKTSLFIMDQHEYLHITD